MIIRLFDTWNWIKIFVITKKLYHIFLFIHFNTVSVNSSKADNDTCFGLFFRKCKCLSHMMFKIHFCHYFQVFVNVFPVEKKISLWKIYNVSIKSMKSWYVKVFLLYTLLTDWCTVPFPHISFSAHFPLIM